MSDRGVSRRTRWRRIISESAHPSINSTNVGGDFVLDKLELVNKFKTLKIKISAWQCFINYELPTLDNINANHVQLMEELQSLYHESILAHTSDKLSYDIIEMISVIGRIKNAGVKLIRSQEAVTETGGCN